MQNACIFKKLVMGRWWRCNPAAWSAGAFLSSSITGCQDGGGGWGPAKGARGESSGLLLQRYTKREWTYWISINIFPLCNCRRPVWKQWNQYTCFTMATVGMSHHSDHIQRCIITEEDQRPLEELLQVVNNSCCSKDNRGRNSSGTSAAKGKQEYKCHFFSLPVFISMT